MYSTVGGAGSSWFRRFGSRARRDLVCFPHAGGAASAFRGWAGLVPASVGLVAVQYPGRQDRIGEPPVTEMGVLADAVAAELRRGGGGAPVVLFGHSMGAVVAFEVARRLGPGVVGRVFVSAARPPGEPRLAGVRVDDDASLLAYLGSLGGAGVELYEDPELRALLLPAVRADLGMLVRYRYQPGPALRCPITAIVGETDPSCTAARADGWAAYTTGGHFYLESDPRAVVRLVTEQP